MRVLITVQYEFIPKTLMCTPVMWDRQKDGGQNSQLCDGRPLTLHRISPARPTSVKPALNTQAVTWVSVPATNPERIMVKENMA